MTNNKKGVLFGGKFFLVDSTDDIDVNKLTNGVSGSDIATISHTPADGAVNEAKSQEEFDAMTDEEKVAYISSLHSFEAEEDNTNSVGTVAWLKHELDAADVTYDQNSRQAELRTLFIDQFNPFEQ